MPPESSVIVPCFEEHDYISGTLEDLHATL